MTLASNSQDAQDRAEASFKKEQRARDGAQAMAEYEAAVVAAREKTARLRALRLAKEAADKKLEAENEEKQQKPSLKAPTALKTEPRRRA